jgi:OFA family oxalate/formate antiporter-like MFS transporter
MIPTPERSRPNKATRDLVGLLVASRVVERRVDGGYGWVAVAAAFTAHFIAFGIIYSFTVFFPSILAEFGQGRGKTSWIVSIAAGLMLGAGGLTGRLSDRFGPGWVLGAGGVLISSGLTLTSLATSIWHVYFAYGLILGLGVSCAFVPSVATVGQWFDRRRGLATGIAVAGTGIGSLVLAPLSSRLIDAFGWRPAMRVIAALGLVALLGAGSVMRARFAGPRRGGAWAAARGNRTFKLLFLSALVAAYGYWVPFVHLVPYAEDRGISRASAAVLVSIIGIANTAGRVLMGAVADRIGRHRMMQFSAFAMAAAMLTWPYARSWGALAVFGVFYALFAGAFIALLPALAGDYFGMNRLAGITGMLFSGAALGTLFGAPVTGMLFDSQGSYGFGIVLAAISLAVGALLLLGLPAPSRPSAAPIARSTLD